MKNNGTKINKWKAAFYCLSLEQNIIRLNREGSYEDVLPLVQERISFGKKYAPGKTRGKKLDILEYTYAACLVKLGRYNEALQYYPREKMVHIIANEQIAQGIPVSRLDILPYIQIILDSARNPDPDRRCLDADYDYARQWLASFYIENGNFVDAMSITMEDIIDRKIGERSSRSALDAYLTFGRSALELGFYEYAKTSLTTAYQMAVKILDKKSDFDANRYYLIFMNLFSVYLGLDDLEEADFALSCATEFLEERIRIQRRKSGSECDIPQVDEIAREKIIHSKSVFFFLQEQYAKALEYSDWAVSIHHKMRQDAPEKYECYLDQIYLEFLAANVVDHLQVEHGRTSVSDERILNMLREITHTVDEMEMITTGEVRRDLVSYIQYYVDFIFSYWICFPGHSISTSELYRMELNLKNIDADISYAQNRCICQEPAVWDAFSQDYKNWQEDYQKAAFEKEDFPTYYRVLHEQQRRLDIKQYHIIKNRKYEFICYEPQALQEHLPKHRVVLEFRKFVRFGGKAFGGEADEEWYGAFLITNHQILFQPLDTARKIDTAIGEFLDELLEQDLLDVNDIPIQMLSALEALLLMPFYQDLRQSKEVYLIPDNELYKIPFELMPIWQEQNSSPTKICYLASARSILREHRPNSSYRSIRVVANPDFWVTSAQAAEHTETTGMAENVRKGMLDTLRDAKVSPLKYTKLEAGLIARVFEANHNRAEIVEGKKACKDYVLSGRADILHFATHGFALPPETDEDTEKSISIHYKQDRVRRIAASVDGLYRCGLFLAGVDNWLQGQEVIGFGNGILTGMDILAEDLSAYRLAVLSACDTAQNVNGNGSDGLEGLRSAFELAGIPLLVCSLWRGGDFVTAFFMGGFYRQLLCCGDPLAALKEAKQRIQNLTYEDLGQKGFQEQADELYTQRMALSRDECPFSHPRYWAGFLLHGAVF